MLRLKSTIYKLTASASVVAFAGCAAGGHNFQGTLPTGSSASVEAGSALSTHPTAPWMSPDAKAMNLVYISDQGTQDVYAYSYPQGKLEGTLTGFTFPAGECSNKAGDIFISNSFANNIIEYAHGGTSPIATLSIPNYYPSGCSVDPATGNLAVANYQFSTKGSGTISIFPSSTGVPMQYTDPHIFHMYFCGYDNKSNLFVDGTTKKGAFAFAELPVGSAKFTDIVLNKPIASPGNVQWDGTYVAVGDQLGGIIYQFTIANKKGTAKGSTPLTGSGQVVQYWIQTPNVVAPTANSSDAGIWKYPAGGNPVKTITGFSDPIGATVSVAKGS
jgi:hypothetical protein